MGMYFIYYIFVESIHDVPRIVRKYKDVSFLEKFARLERNLLLS